MATQTFTRAPRTFNTKTPAVPATTATPTTATPTVDSLRAQLGTAQQLLDQRKASSVNTPSATIPATSLTQANPVSLAPNISSATPTGLEQFITSSTIDPYKAQKQAEIDSLTKDQAGLQESIAGVYQSLVGQGARSEEIYKQLGVDSAKKEVDNLTSQIEAEQLANRRQIEELQKNNPSGLFGGALTDEVNRINTLSLQKQADLSIVQSAALRRYDTASAIADRKIQMEFEPLKVQLDALKFFYSNNQATLSKKEDQQFQQKITEDERAYNEKYQAAKTLQDTKLQLLQSAASQRASTSVQLAIQNSTTAEGAIQAAGQYAGDILDRQYKQAQIANIQSEISTRASAGDGTLNGKPQTAPQAQAQGFADRLAQANVTIGELGGGFTGSFSNLGKYLPNALKSSDRQVYEQAQTNFVTALLRRESGAAISKDEFDTAREQYFPQGGDSKETVLAKEQNRNTVINNLYRESNVKRPALPGDIVESGGVKYRVGLDGETLEKI